jgi:Ser/Thr protein kinase RdoA (MazF antagonist)
VDLLELLRRRHDLQLVADGNLTGGYESRCTKMRSGDRSFVLRESPSWRSLDEVSWAYELAWFAKMEIPEAIAPIRAVDGTLACTYEGRVISLFPFVDGAPLDRSSERERDNAAWLLARLHHVLGRRQVPPRPASRPDAPAHVPTIEPIFDPGLDEEVARFTTTSAVVHGDFYRGNLRCRNHSIVGLFDWDDARMWTLENELAWSVWEFAQVDATLDTIRARRFVDVYAAHSNPTWHNLDFIIPFIRDHLRTEIRRAAARVELGLDIDSAYVARSRQAFVNLAVVAL